MVCLPLSCFNELLLFLAFGFCLEYKRKAEFHKLCDIVSEVLELRFIIFHFLFVVAITVQTLIITISLLLSSLPSSFLPSPLTFLPSPFFSHLLPPLPLQLRTHLRNAQEHQQAQNCLKFDNPETIQCLVEVRFEQLDKAISIDLWQVSGR